MQGSSEETDIKNRLRDMGREEERVRYGQSNMETYIIICKIDSQWEFVYGSGISNRGSVSTWRGGMGKQMGGRFKRERIYVYLWLIHADV